MLHALLRQNHVVLVLSFWKVPVKTLYVLRLVPNDLILGLEPEDKKVFSYRGQNIIL